MENSEAATRLIVGKLGKLLNRTFSSDEILLPKKLIQELRTKFEHLPENLADIESEIMNFTAQLSCQGMIKDDVKYQ